MHLFMAWGTEGNKIGQHIFMSEIPVSNVMHLQTMPCLFGWSTAHYAAITIDPHAILFFLFPFFTTDVSLIEFTMCPHCYTL